MSWYLKKSVSKESMHDYHDDYFLLVVIQRLHQGVHPQQSTPSPYATLWTTGKICKFYRTNFSPSNFTKVDFLLR